jgi:hypothetical protein
MSSSSSDDSFNNNQQQQEEEYAIVAPPSGPRWIQYLPAGIRGAVEASKYRWCAREAGLWGIATGTAMTLHRFRMHSPVTRAVHVGFVTMMGVYVGSYYFCVKRRDHEEHMIQLMMKLNSFEPASIMPEERPIDETHPFVAPGKGEKGDVLAQKQYVVNLPERKEWQPKLPAPELKDVLKPVVNSSNNNHDTEAKP